MAELAKLDPMTRRKVTVNHGVQDADISGAAVEGTSSFRTGSTGVILGVFYDPSLWKKLSWDERKDVFKDKSKGEKVNSDNAKRQCIKAKAWIEKLEKRSTGKGAGHYGGRGGGCNNGGRGGGNNGGPGTGNNQNRSERFADKIKGVKKFKTLVSSVKASEERLDKIDGSLDNVKDAMVLLAKSNQDITSSLKSLKRAAEVGSIETEKPSKKAKVSFGTAAKSSSSNDNAVKSIEDLDDAEDLVERITSQLSHSQH